MAWFLGMLVGAPRLGFADAAPITSVALGDAGPDKDVPTTDPFYLTGPVEPDVSAVYAVFVRVGNPPFGIGSAMSCADAAGALTVEQLRKLDKSESTALDQSFGIVPIDALWSGPSAGGDPRARYEHLVTWHNAYVPMAWKRPENEKTDTEDDRKKASKTFQVLVSEPRFFRPGATYCLLTYEQHRANQSEQDRIRKLIWTNQQADARCAREGEQAGKACARLLAPEQKACGEKATRAAETCKETAADGLIKGIETLLARKVDAGDTAAALKAVRLKLFAAATTITRFDKAIAEDLARAPAPRFLADPWQPSKRFLPVETDALARLIVEALSAKDIHRQVPPSAPAASAAAPVTYSTRDGRSAIRALRVLPDLSAIDVAASESPAAADVVTVPLHPGSLAVHGATTLEDVLRLAEGQVRTPEGYVAVKGELYDKLIQPVADDIREAIKNGADLPASVDAMGPLAERFEELRDALDALCAARARADTIAAAVGRPTSETLAALSGQWLEAAALGSCGPYRKSAQNGSRANPLSALATDLAVFNQAVATWRGAKKDIEARWTELRLTSPRRVIRVETRLTQQRFITNYLTPFIGRAAAIKPGDDLGMTYLGLHLTLYPNLIDEPMWSNGFTTDLYRLLSLEVGMAFEAPTDGAGRFKGPGPLNPLFLGLALQPIPYVTGSVGVAFMERRTSPLATEETQFYPSFYVGVSAEVNFLDGVRKLAIGKGTAFIQGKDVPQ